jgi:hypothetical protein
VMAELLTPSSRFVSSDINKVQVVPNSVIGHSFFHQVIKIPTPTFSLPRSRYVTMADVTPPSRVFDINGRPISSFPSPYIMIMRTTWLAAQSVTQLVQKYTNIPKTERNRQAILEGHLFYIFELYSRSHYD